ncbi:hypothetical protein LTR95_015866 [Oleoguttula sp. CCFEE 5521]
MASMSPAPVATSTPAPDVGANTAALKRKRSPSIPAGTPSATQQPAAKAPKTTSSNQLSINYLARQSQEDLPLISKDATLPNSLHLLSQYSNILDRHESLASNLGARPLGPILIKRFERCFDAPPKVIASHHKGASANTSDEVPQGHITWLEVIEFARSHPAQFTLATFSEGRRVCQFYYPQKQLRVQVSEEDYLFINSGRCQELIPPLPIWEDEEKEVGTCDVLEAKLKELTNVADMVAARTRQLGHRLKGRRAAILERRADGGIGTPAKANALQTTTAPSTQAGGTPFTAVNGLANGEASQGTELVSSATVRNDLLRHFESLPHNQPQPQGRVSQSRHSVVASIDTTAALTSERMNGLASSHDHHNTTAPSSTSSLSPVPTELFAAPSTITKPPLDPTQSSAYSYAPHSASKHNFSRPLPPALESSQPFRPLCQAHMDALPRGTRVLPPCDRCRRLRMDCVKNLTSCAGCTKKHARCHWRDVGRDELDRLEALFESNAQTAPHYGQSYDGAGDYGYSTQDMVWDAHQAGGIASYGDGTDYGAGTYGGTGGYGEEYESEDDDSNPLEDLEALGEQEEQERVDAEGMKGARELVREAVEKAKSELPPGGDEAWAEVEGEGVEGEVTMQVVAPVEQIDLAHDGPVNGVAASEESPENAVDGLPTREVAPESAPTVSESVDAALALVETEPQGNVMNHEMSHWLPIETEEEHKKAEVELQPAAIGSEQGYGGGFKAVNG